MSKKDEIDILKIPAEYKVNKEEKKKKIKRKKMIRKNKKPEKLLSLKLKFD